MEYVMGIDGGGTKTIAVIADVKGYIVAKTVVGPTNPTILSKQDLYNTLRKMVVELKKQAPVQYESVNTLYAGMSGAGSEKMQHILESTIKEILPHIKHVRVEIDTINALYSGTYGGPGIVQISGTGAITYGINSDLTHDRVGGWGYLFGDEGSGYDIGRRGVVAALKSYDGRGAKTILLDMMYTYFDVTNARDLIERIYSVYAPKNKIAPLSKIVFEAYKQDDIVAKEILVDVVKELTLSILTLYNKLFPSNEEVKVVLCGGVFNDKEVLPSLIINELKHYDTIKVTVPKMSPVGGSLIGAYLMKKITPDSKTIDNIMKT